MKADPRSKRRHKIEQVSGPVVNLWVRAEDLAKAFDLWLEKYRINPAGFEAEFETIRRAEFERASHQEPTYGRMCVAYLDVLLEQILIPRGESRP